MTERSVDMKKIGAALLAIFTAAALVGCGKHAEERNTEEVISETVSETITTTAETSAESVSETEEITEKTVSENNYREYVPDLSAGICLAELYFGMSREEAEAAVRADLDKDMLNMYYSVYNNISIDLDENFKSAMFSYGESGLDEITLNLKEMPQKEGFELKDELISKLGGIYGVKTDDWKIESGGYVNYCKSDSISVYLRFYDSGDQVVGTLMLTSWEHRSFKDVERLSVINKKEDPAEKTSSTTETSAENPVEPENIFAAYDESKFPTGTWQDNYTYAYERDENGNITYAYYDENEKIISVYDYKNYAENDNTYAEPLFRKDSHIYEFDGEGHFRVSLQTHDAFGDYTFENNVLTLTFRTDFGDEGVFINRCSFETVKEENGYRLYLDTSKSTEMIELPSVIDMEQVSYIELSAGLSSLFDTFYKRKSFFIEYIDGADPNNFKSYIDTADSIS